MEIGGYIEFERYKRKMLHEGAIKLNCGRNALSYLIEAKNKEDCYAQIYVRLL